MTKKLTIRGWIALLATLVLWASGFIGIRAGLTAYSPTRLAILRFLAASATMLVYAVIARVRLPRYQDLPQLFITGLVSIALYHVALNLGEQTVTGGAASMLVASAPIFSALLAKVFQHDRLRMWGWLGIAISFAGVSLIAMGEEGGVHFSRGALLVLLAALASGTSILLQKQYLKKYKPDEFATHLVLVGTLYLLVFLPGLPSAVARAPLAATMAVIYIGVFPAAIAYISWGYVLGRIPVAIAASSLYTTPVFAILIGWIWLREVPSALSLIGGALAFAGVVLVNTKGHVSRPLELPAEADYAARGD